MEVNWEKKHQNPLYDLTTNQKPFNGILPIVDRETYRFLQNQDIKTRTLVGAFNYYYLLIKGGKGKKDRKTVLSPLLLVMLRNYYKDYKPSYWLFEGHRRVVTILPQAFRLCSEER